ncbi:hypothetical protein EVAR_18968_1 [Eumeta japonica]|uniref:Uncharacterized protein n=1 Tax=Eumeta variegata TaxID=151549 RepID=A0A4C1X011_EUMVA|nr:hypothetical protein EVAR_18968_1 [Eumeta japonica]
MGAVDVIRFRTVVSTIKAKSARSSTPPFGLPLRRFPRCCEIAIDYSQYLILIFRVRSWACAEIGGERRVRRYILLHQSRAIVSYLGRPCKNSQ